MQHVGMPPHRARCAAGCIQQYGIEGLRRFPIHNVGVDSLRVQLRTFQIGHQPVHPPRTVIKCGHRKARSRKLHGLAPRRGAKIKRTLASSVTQQPRRQAGGQVLHPPGALVIAIQFLHRRTARQAYMAGQQADAVQPLCPCSGG